MIRHTTPILAGVLIGLAVFVAAAFVVSEFCDRFAQRLVHL